MPWLLKTYNSDERLSDSQPSRAVFSNGLLKFSQAKSLLIRSEQREGDEESALMLTAVLLPWKQQWCGVGAGSPAVRNKGMMTWGDGEWQIIGWALWSSISSHLFKFFFFFKNRNFGSRGYFIIEYTLLWHSWQTNVCKYLKVQSQICFKISISNIYVMR